MFNNAFIVSLTSLNNYSHFILENFLTKNYNQVDASKQLLDKTDNLSKKDESSVREDSSGDIIPVTSDNHSRAISDDRMDERNGNILDNDNIIEAGEFYE